MDVGNLAESQPYGKGRERLHQGHEGVVLGPEGTGDEGNVEVPEDQLNLPVFPALTLPCGTTLVTGSWCPALIELATQVFVVHACHHSASDEGTGSGSTLI